MRLPRKSLLFGALLGLIPIALGVVALVTPKWVYDTPSTGNSNGLFGTIVYKNNTLNPSCEKPNPQIIQGLEIGGVAAILVGIITTILLNMLIKNRWIRLLPQIFLILGPTAILIGLILLLECAQNSGLGYSIILMIAACILGYILAMYLAFASGLGRHGHHNSSTVIIRESVRF